MKMRKTVSCDPKIQGGQRVQGKQNMENRWPNRKCSAQYVVKEDILICRFFF